MVKPTQARSQARMLPWVVWIVAAVFFFFNYMNQVVPSAMEGPLTKAFHIDATMLGTIAAVYFYIYAVMQIPVGVLVDHFGPHRSLGCAAVLAAAGCLLFSFVSTVDMAIVTRMMIGAGARFSFIASLKLITNWFPANRFGTMTGLTNIVGMLGAIVGVGLLTNLTLAMGWRQTVLLLGVVGGILAGLIFFLVAITRPLHPRNRNTRRSVRESGKYSAAWHRFFLRARTGSTGSMRRPSTHPISRWGPSGAPNTCKRPISWISRMLPCSLR